MGQRKTRKNINLNNIGKTPTPSKKKKRREEGVIKGSRLTSVHKSRGGAADSGDGPL